MMPRPCTSINLRVERASVHAGEAPLVEDVHWDAEGGQLWALLGTNGAGKSSLLARLAGFSAPGATLGGDVRYGGCRLEDWSARERASRVAYLPQSPDSTEGLTVREVLLLGRAPRRGPFGAPSRDDLDAVTRALERFDLASRQAREPHTLSAGEQQRMHLARIWVQNADVWLLDEPYANLDFAHQRHAIDSLVEQTEAGRLVVVVAHDLLLLPRAATHVALLHGGRLVAAGPRDDVWTAAHAERAFGVPFELHRGLPLPELSTSRS